MRCANHATNWLALLTTEVDIACIVVLKMCLVSIQHHLVAHAVSGGVDI